MIALWQLIFLTVAVNILGSITPSISVVMFTLRSFVKWRNLRLFNRYQWLISHSPLIMNYETFLDNYAGYALGLKPKDIDFDTFNIFRYFLANRKLKRINGSIQSFVDVRQREDPLRRFPIIRNFWINHKLLRYSLESIDISLLPCIKFNFKLCEHGFMESPPSRYYFILKLVDTKKSVSSFKSSIKKLQSKIKYGYYIEDKDEYRFLKLRRRVYKVKKITFLDSPKWTKDQIKNCDLDHNMSSFLKRNSIFIKDYREKILEFLTTNGFVKD